MGEKQRKKENEVGEGNKLFSRSVFYKLLRPVKRKLIWRCRAYY
jgi:hypothetical protein